MALASTFSDHVAVVGLGHLGVQLARPEGDLEVRQVVVGQGEQGARAGDVHSRIPQTIRIGIEA